MLSTFIVYACPTGELADQLDRYFSKSLALCGANAAHHYMPHCSLTGFFQDEEQAVPLYLRAIAQALQQSPPPPPPVLAVTAMTLRADWHGLELQSNWLKYVVAQFAEQADSATRPHPLRLKDWLHLSLAYGFPAEQAETLAHLARSQVDCTAPAGWDLRFYQRHGDQSWTCHDSRGLSSDS